MIFLMNPQNIRIRNKIFLEHQIGVLEWFLKDHVTLKNDVMASNDVALPSQE